VRKVIVAFAVLVFTATVAAALVQIERYRTSRRTLDPLEKTTCIETSFEYDVMPGPKMRTFDLASDVTLTGPDSRARLVFNFTDFRNHHYVEVTPRSVEIVVVQDGIGRVLESVAELSVSVGEAHHVTVRRRELAIRVSVDDVVLAEAYDETFHSGQVGQASVPGEVSFTTPRVQSVAEIYFADDFMRAEKEKGPWTELRGEWRVYALTHSSMSANAFQYVVEGKEEAGAVAGHPFWDDYSFEVCVRPQKRAAFGLYFYYRDENNYFRFQWYPEESGVPGSGRKELIRMWHGEKTVVAERAGGFQLNQWYALRCQVSGQRLQTTIDENLVFDLHESKLTSGMVGLWADEMSRTFFDDVFVRSHRSFEDRFTNGGTGAWTFIGGKWSRVVLGSRHRTDTSTDVPPTGVLTVRSPAGECRAAVGSAAWKNYVVETEIHPDATGRSGVVLYYQDETRYYQVVCRRDTEAAETWELQRVLDDERTVLDETTVDAREGRRRVQAGIRDGYIRVRVNGRKVLEGFDTSLTSGRAGLYAADARLVSFGPVKVDWPLEAPPILTLNEVFEHETSMANWSDIESDWRRTAAGLWLHKGDFPGDAAIETDVESLQAKDAEMGLLLSMSADTVEEGYLLKLGTGTEGLTLELLRQGKTLASTSLETDVPVTRLGFKRHGDYLVGYVNRKPRLWQRDREALKGYGLGWYARGVKVDTASVSVSSPNVHEYLFRRAYTDWRVVKGIWEVTNRWQCDPRWTFFSGRSSWRLAAIWNKRRLAGDVTLDFYAGPKMDRDRGNSYQYAADINCTIAGNGVDLSSGYSFLFGGFGNTKTALMKGDQVVAEAKWPDTGRPALIETSNLHRRWYHIKVQKKGSRLRMWLEDQLVIDHEDPTPLTGDRVAIWTWNNGIMVARVTVSAEDAGTCESPDAYKPVHCRSVYDTEAVASR